MKDIIKEKENFEKNKYKKRKDQEKLYLVLFTLFMGIFVLFFIYICAERML